MFLIASVTTGLLLLVVALVPKVVPATTK